MGTAGLVDATAAERLRMSQGIRTASPGRDALLLAAIALALYIVTLAPTVLWFDGGYLQFLAAQGSLKASAGSHPLWVFAAHQFTYLPLGDVAWRVNFSSAVFAAVTIGLVYLVLYEMGVRRYPRLVATLAFMVSHTFWSNAVTAEVYALTLMLMTLQVWSMLRWRGSGQMRYLALAGAALGLGIVTHLLALLYAPALVWLLCRERARLTWRAILGFGIALLICIAPLVLLALHDAWLVGLHGWEVIRWAVFSSDGIDFSGAFFDFSAVLLPSDLFQWVAFLGLQFVGLAGLCGLVGAVTIWRAAERSVAVYMLLLYLGVMAFAFAYRIGERYVFYLPGYLSFTVWIGFGVQWLWSRVTRLRSRWLQALLLVLVLVVPVAFYRVAPELVSRGLTFRPTRHVPGSHSKYYFLWPPKNGYTDARLYAEGVLAALPSDAILFADHVLFFPVRFVHEIEGVRPDVSVEICCGAELAAAVAARGARPLAIADTNPDIYPLERLQESYDIVPHGSVFLLVLRGE